MSDTTIPETTWQDWVTRTTAILAVLAALSSGRWGASNLQAILEQGKVNDAWAFYQAKSLKEHGAEQMRDLARALAVDAGARGPALDALVKAMDAQATKEKEDKAKRHADANEYEKRRDVLVEGSFWFEVSFACLQLGVILCTIATGAKKRFPWHFGIVFGVVGLVLILNGFERTRFMRAPRWFYEGTSADLAYEPEPPK